MLGLREGNWWYGGPKLEEDSHIILGGLKWDELQQRFKIKRPLLQRFVRSAQRSQWSQIMHLCTYYINAVCMQLKNKQWKNEGYRTECERESEFYCLIIFVLSTLQFLFPLPGSSQLLFFKGSENRNNTVHQTEERQTDWGDGAPAGSSTQHGDSLPVKMIHSWTRKCFPYSTSGLRSVERVMDIIVRQYHSERFTHRDSSFTALFLFSFIFFFHLIFDSPSLFPFAHFLLSGSFTHTHTLLSSWVRLRHWESHVL